MSEREFPYGKFYQEKEVASDFETRVWQKIRRKKTKRRITTASFALAGIVASLLIFQVFQTQPSGLQTSNVQSITKEEVPLIENLIFAVSDRQTNYSLEPVSYKTRAKGNRTEI